MSIWPWSCNVFTSRTTRTCRRSMISLGYRGFVCLARWCIRTDPPTYSRVERDRRVPWTSWVVESLSSRKMYFIGGTYNIAWGSQEKGALYDLSNHLIRTNQGYEWQLILTSIFSAWVMSDVQNMKKSGRVILHCPSLKNDANTYWPCSFVLLRFMNKQDDQCEWHDSWVH